MKTIVPLNISALRVNHTDATLGLSKKTKGKIARFEIIDKKPFCTGNDIITDWAKTEQSFLNIGIHIHWELPDYFKKGIQKPGGKDVVFPQAPNRWLVIRTLCESEDRACESGKIQWSSPKHQCWLIESDFVSSKKPNGESISLLKRKFTAIPLSCDGKKNFSYLGRVVKPGEKNDGKELYLKDFKEVDGTSMYLTAVGFLGPQFSSYYPDCSSVFGFHDNFEDNSRIHKAIGNNDKITFKASYQVIGWIDGSEDPMDMALKQAKKEYDEYQKICEDTSVEKKRSLIDFWLDFTEKTLGWDFCTDTLDPLKLPDKTICNGIIQEIVWNNAENFIQEVTYDDNSRIAIGNTKAEALSALMKDDKKNRLNADQQSKYESLLNMLQAGKLDDLESRRNILSELVNEMHHNNFVREHGDLKWTINLDEMEETPERQTYPVLPKNLDLQLEKLNKAQNMYDIASHSLTALRKQLFMDWFTYAEYMCEPKTPRSEEIKKFIDEKLRPFINNQLKEEQQKSIETGELKYGKEKNTIVSLNSTDRSKNSMATKVSEEFTQLQKLMEKESAGMKLMAVPASPFYSPTEPVAVIETACLETINRNKDGLLRVRTLNELIDTLRVKNRDFEAEVTASDIDHVKIEIPDSINDVDLLASIKQLFIEGMMLIPSNSKIIANAFINKGGANNPACNNSQYFIDALKLLQGGQSRLDVKQEASTGLFKTIRIQEPVLNPEEHTETPLSLSLFFTNEMKMAVPPDSSGWNCQEYYDVSNSFQPFHPLFLNWEVQFKSLIRHSYNEKSITDCFELDKDGNNYKLKENITIEADNDIEYEGSTILLKNNVQNFSDRMDKMIGSTNSGLLQKQRNSLQARKIVSIELNGFRENQLMRKSLPVWDINEGNDDLTNDLVSQITDTCRMQGFNNESPKREGFDTSSEMEKKFHPIRDGYLEINKIEFIDVFGQKMLLSIQPKFLKIIPAQSLTDGKNADKVFFYPRLLSPAHINADWSRDGDNTSPVWGWIVPDNLNNNLFFFDVTGNPIGSFGIEHGKVVYRPCPGKKEPNKFTITDSDLLIKDIGNQGDPKIHKKLAAFMWYVYGKDASFFTKLHYSIDNSSKFINGNTSLKDGSLSVLIGQPVALATTTLKMETAGNVLPVNQVFSAWKKDIEQKRTYTQRIENTSANLGNVQFPLRLGDTPDTSDGLIGYLIEESNQNIYTDDGLILLYGSIEEKGEIMVKLNQAFNITVIFAPDSSIHFKSGILPVSTLHIEQEQYADLVNRLNVIFPAYHVFQQYNRFDITMPEHDKFSWKWIYADSRPETPLNQDSSSLINYGYSPQTIEEGWLKLEYNKENKQ